jgi:hypothetical protein
MLIATVNINAIAAVRIAVVRNLVFMQSNVSRSPLFDRRTKLLSGPFLQPRIP